MSGPAAGSVRVARAEEEDLPALAGLRWSWIVEDDGSAPTVDRAGFVAELVRWAREHRTTHTAFVALHGADVVGMAWLAVTDRVPSPRALERRTGDVQSVYVVPGARGHGVGALLVEAVVAEAGRCGLERVVVHSRDGSVSLYDRAGFASSARLRDLVPPSGRTP